MHLGPGTAAFCRAVKLVSPQEAEGVENYFPMASRFTLESSLPRTISKAKREYLEASEHAELSICDLSFVPAQLSY